MPLSERTESIWFATLAGLQMALSLALVVLAVAAVHESTNGWATSVTIVIAGLLSFCAHGALVVYAVKMPQNLDYDMLLGISAGLLLMFVEAAVLATGDGDGFLAFVDENSRVPEELQPLPHECIAGGCGWYVLTDALKAAVLGKATLWDPVITLSLVCMVVQLTIVVVGSYQRCGLTASDDRYVK
jgi:hypothetical protein